MTRTWLPMTTMTTTTARLLGIIVALGLFGCGKSMAGDEPRAGDGDQTVRAEIGKPAPDFTLKDLDGKEVKLSSFKGKTVVLEWFNPDCPFVQRTHGEGGPLATLASKVAGEGVVWLAVNSGAPGKQGAGVERNKQAVTELALPHPVLLDESGAVGKRYAASNTPGMYVIDEAQVLRYAGAIDNAPRGSPPDGEAYRNHVVEALSDLAAKREVRVSETKQYGCSVKYPD